MEAPRRRPSPSLVISCIALFVALAGTAAAQIEGSSTTPQQRADGINKKALKTALNGMSGVIGTKQLKPDSVTSPIIAPAAVTTPDIGQAAVVANQLGSGAVTAPKIQPGAVGTSQLAGGAVTTPKIGSGAVTETQIGSGAVGSGKLKDQAVTTPKIQPEAITTPLIQPNAVTGPKIGPQAINSNLLANQSVGTEQLSSAIPSVSVKSTSITCRNSGAYAGNHYSSEVFDTAGMFPGGTGGADYSVRAPVDGVYQVTATQTWAGDSSGGTRSMEFNGREADGSTPFGPLGSSTVQPINGGAIETPQTLTGIYQLSAGQSVEVWTGASGLAGSSSGCGATSTSFGNTGARASTLTMTYIAPGPSS